MSSPSRRRRSRSASAHFSLSTPSQLARKHATKRSLPHRLSTPLKDSSPSYTWDIDSYRRGKGRKKSASAGSDGSWNRRRGFSQISTFAVSSNDFGLPLGNSRSWRSPITTTTSSQTDVLHTESHDNMQTLRSHAFCELQRSVAENGEGLVRRMQEQEYQRSRDERGISLRIDASPARSPVRRYSQSDGDGDEEEIQIYAGEPFDWYNSHPLPQDIAMDTDSHPSRSSYDACSAPLRARLGPNLFPSPPSSPISNGISKSDSLPQAPLVFPLCQFATTDTLRLRSRHELRGTGTEKAIDDLALELANGAGGLNDYAPLRHNGDDDVEICDAGELWS